jgi:hypothetical protein
MAERLGTQLQPSGLQRSLNTGLLPTAENAVIETSAEPLVYASVFGGFFIFGSSVTDAGSSWLVAA